MPATCSVAITVLRVAFAPSRTLDFSRSAFCCLRTLCPSFDDRFVARHP